ncbi:MAG: HEAT repeat domain-containing protein [Planctomycetota bacterium]|nr:HEAT repeat domain-containing protein [Planctomycetota bacterium]
MMIGRSQSSWYLSALVLVGLCAIAFTGTARAEEDKTAQIEKAFREGVDLYQQGRLADAQRKLKEVLSLDPRKELVARLIEEAGSKVMARMMADVKMGNEPTYLWQLMRQYQVKKLADKERMAKMAQRLVDPATTEDERALLYREFGELGHYSVPVLAPYLKDATHEDYRTFARIAISRMGPSAIPPVLELLQHTDVLMRENAILVLSDIQPLDPRAIPALKARLEDPKDTATVKSAAERTLQRISGLQSAALKSAAECYYDAAHRYMLDRPGVPEEAEVEDGIIYHLNAEGNLVGVQYPLWAWNDQMAEECVLRGLAANPKDTGLLALWACVMAAQYTEVKDLMDIINEQPALHTFSAEEKKDVEAWDKKMVDARRLVAAVGKEHINLAINKMLADIRKYPGHTRLPQIGAFLGREMAALDPRGNLLTPPPEIVVEAVPGKDPLVVKATTPVTIKADNVLVRVTVKEASLEVSATPIVAPAAAGAKDKEKKEEKKEEPKKPEAKQEEAKKEVQPPAPPPAPEAAAAPAVPAGSASGLVNGLDCPEEAVQYACALSLASINRYPNRWMGSEKVAAILARGVSENKALQILLVEENHNVSNELRARLEALGYGVTAAISARDGLVQARSFPPKDIAIVDENLRRDLSAEQLLEEFKADVRTRYLPVGILHLQKDRTVVQSRFGAEMPLVEREMGGNDLKTAVEAVAAKRPAETVTKRKAHEVSVACATALAKVDPHGTQLVLDDAVDAAIAALVNRKDEVRNPCAIFLGGVEGGNKKAEAGEKLKAVVLDTKNVVELRRNALRSLGRVQKEGLEDAYAKLQADPDQEIKDLAAEAFGQTSRANEAVTNFIRTERIDKEKKEK